MWTRKNLSECFCCCCCCCCCCYCCCCCCCCCCCYCCCCLDCILIVLASIWLLRWRTLVFCVLYLDLFQLLDVRYPSRHKSFSHSYLSSWYKWMNAQVCKQAREARTEGMQWGTGSIHERMRTAAFFPTTLQAVQAWAKRQHAVCVRSRTQLYKHSCGTAATNTTVKTNLHGDCI